MAKEREIFVNGCKEKDIDGLTTKNIGDLFTGNDCLISCTPYGIIKILLN